MPPENNYTIMIAEILPIVNYFIIKSVKSVALLLAFLFKVAD